MVLWVIVACSGPATQTPSARQGVKRAANDSDSLHKTNERRSSVRDDDSEFRNSSDSSSAKLSKVDPASLFIVNVRVGTFRDKRLVHELVSYESDGRSDYVYYRVCPLEKTDQDCEGDACETGGECIENIYTLDRVILPVLKAGQVLVGVRACVEKERSKSSRETCGPWNEILHNTLRRDQVAEKLLIEKDRVLGSLDKLENDFRNALETFRDEAYECLERDSEAHKHLESKIRFADLIMRAPVGWMTDSVKMHASNMVSTVGLEEEFGAVGKAIGELGGEVSEFLAEQCEGLGEQWCGYLRQVKELGGTMLAAFNPVHSVGVLSGAIHDLTSDPEDLVKRSCQAESAFQQRQNAIEQYWVNKADRLRSIKEQLAQKGYL